MSLKLRTRAFKVVEATLGASLFRPYWTKFDPTLSANQVTWAFCFECSERAFEGEVWKPEFTFDSLVLPIKNWVDLQGLLIQLPRGRCRVIGHDDVGPAEVQLGKRSGSRFHATSNGLCDIGWGDTFGRDVPFTLEAQVNFSGIRVVGTSDDDDASLTQFLESHFETKKLAANPCEESGTPRRSKKMIEKVFSPA